MRRIKRILRWLPVVAALGALAFVYITSGPGVFSAARWEAGAEALIARSDRTHEAVTAAIRRFADPRDTAEGEPGLSSESLWSLLRSAIQEQQAVEDELRALFAAVPSYDVLFVSRVSRDAYVEYVHGRQLFYADVVEGLRSGDPLHLVALLEGYEAQDAARRSLLGVPPVHWQVPRADPAQETGTPDEATPPADQPDTGGPES